LHLSLALRKVRTWSPMNSSTCGKTVALYLELEDRYFCANCPASWAPFGLRKTSIGAPNSGGTREILPVADRKSRVPSGERRSAGTLWGVEFSIKIDQPAWEDDFPTLAAQFEVCTALLPLLWNTRDVRCCPAPNSSSCAGTSDGPSSYSNGQPLVWRGWLGKLILPPICSAEHHAIGECGGLPRTLSVSLHRNDARAYVQVPCRGQGATPTICICRFGNPDHSQCGAVACATVKSCVVALGTPGVPGL